MTAFQIILMGLLIICAVSVSFSKNLLNAILIYMSFSLVMSMLWICLESPDLAITEAVKRDPQRNIRKPLPSDFSDGFPDRRIPIWAKWKCTPRRSFRSIPK